MGNTFAISITRTQEELSCSLPLFSGLPVPLHCLLKVLGNTFAFLITPTQVVLSVSIPLFSGLPVPLHSLHKVEGNTFAISITPPQVELSVSIPLFSGLPVALHSLSRGCRQFCFIAEELFDKVPIRITGGTGSADKHSQQDQQPLENTFAFPRRCTGKSFSKLRTAVETFRRIFTQPAFQGLIYCAGNSFNGAHRTFQDSFTQDGRITAVKGEISGKHFIGHNRQSVLVCLFILFRTVPLFRSHVGSGPGSPPVGH